MAREELRRELPVAFRKARQSNESVLLRNLKLGTNGGHQLVDVTVQRLDTPDQVRGMLMIVFADVPTIIEMETQKKKQGKQKRIRSGKTTGT